MVNMKEKMKMTTKTKKRTKSSREEYKCQSCGATRMGNVTDQDFLECCECDGLAEKVSSIQRKDSQEIARRLME